MILGLILLNAPRTDQMDDYVPIFIGIPHRYNPQFEITISKKSKEVHPTTDSTHSGINFG